MPRYVCRAHAHLQSLNTVLGWIFVVMIKSKITNIDVWLESSRITTGMRFVLDVSFFFHQNLRKRMHK